MDKCALVEVLGELILVSVEVDRRALASALEVVARRLEVVDPSLIYI